MQYCKQAGGATSAGKDLVHRLSRIGSKGKHLQNCERDLHFAVNSFGKTLKVQHIQGQCRMWDPSLNEVVQMDICFIDPVSLAEALWRKGRHIFRKVFFGGLNEDEVQAYWENCSQRCEFFKKSAAASWDASSWRRLAPISVYGDDVSNYRATEAGNISILAWTSDLARGNSPFLRYLLISQYSEYTASEHTYNDIMETWFIRCPFCMVCENLLHTYIYIQYTYECAHILSVLRLSTHTCRRWCFLDYNICATAPLTMLGRPLDTRSY